MEGKSIKNVEWEKYFSENPAPDDFDDRKSQMEAFCKSHVGRIPIALVTSGGTSVPLERNTVRFIDNLSTGERGAASTEYLLDRGYAVILLYRSGLEKNPFMRHVDLLSMLDSLQEDGKGIHLKEEYMKKLIPTWREYQTVKSAGRTLTIPFSTISEYLWFLRGGAECLQEHAPKSLVYLAAAVADFYLPPKMMADHKIQSSTGPLTLHLEPTPKMLQPLCSIWAPDLFIVTFKLETNEKILMEKAQLAMQNYKHTLVIGNIMKYKREECYFITQKGNVLLHPHGLHALQGVEVEQMMIEELVSRHQDFLRGPYTLFE